MIAEIQVVPKPSGNETARYYFVERALDVIKASGLKYEVGALGTTIEGEPAAVWSLLQQIHRAPLDAGADSILTYIKISDHEDRPVTMEELTGPHRPAR
jgi:uncharacterized protein (TIGR00106 family)